MTHFLGVGDWFVKFLELISSNNQSRVRVKGSFSDGFQVQVGLCLSVKLHISIIVLEALFREMRSGCSKELVYTNKLILQGL